MIEEVNDTNFTEETSDGLALVDFWASWCGPCRMQSPILEQLDDEFDDSQLKIYKMNVDENPDTPRMFGIMSIPTLLLKKDGEVIDQVVGVHSLDQLKSIVNNNLA
ncbi:thioredoxin [Enterococcus hirae]|jgi:thioredoxin 1|nr:thioredoxin [Enterococcaceae bacterium]MCI1919194.1 thioredoxin [Enterococcaceae bacterium]MDM8214480.1 thioredoxin [Enterococcus hirae]